MRTWIYSRLHEVDRIAATKDPFVLLRLATERLATAQQEVTELARLRRRVIQDLHSQGLSYAQIAKQAGLSRGRIHQIRHTGPAPEGAFLGTGAVTVVTPLRPDAASDRTLVTLDDLTTGKRLEDLARSFDLEVSSEHVGVNGEIDLNRPGLLVICGPRMSKPVRETYEKDPVLRWQRSPEGRWTLYDSRADKTLRAGTDADPSQSHDIGYLGRLPRPDGKGTVLLIAGVHPPGSIGVVHLLTTEIATLWGQVGDQPFSVVVGVDYDPDTHEPGNVELLTPLYRHEDL
ncbi:sigma-70 family RNA polymerase sigma factor [Actinoallomurus purpureus]|uniref:sigma factor-like helix-turn-helix DNA-binding protein n=1 Tax=Actinoallomurus purpureus TaxID=478114 RepID=UPI002092D43B|nr:sigma factor-like helix-turn-helix DNA-binding protein [Actinoallomurus purpureus]MCO6010082.1 sigma-70 family RNA polymerase sigma factor [Actinoallomurus purpureus]